jgi:CheY-like chemotaxis protein
MMGHPKHILVVDDNADVRDVIVDTLQEHNFSVTAVSSDSMMRDFLETGDTVDCVILDALMPGEVSASLALHLKKHGIPVVMISGSLDPMKDAADNGLQLLRKPFAHKSFTVPSTWRSPAVSSDREHKAAAELKKDGRKRQCPDGMCLIGPEPPPL